LKKIIISFCFCVLISPVFAETPTIQIIETASKSKGQPAWTEEGDTIGTFNGKKVIFFVGYGTSKYKDTAYNEAIVNASGYAATAIRVIATKEVAKSWEALGIGENQQKEQVMKGIESISAKNINVSGMIETSKWWRYVRKPDFDKEGKFIGLKTPVYEYYIRYALDYKIYETRMNEIIRKVKAEPVKKKEEPKEEPKKEEIQKEEPKKEEPKKEVSQSEDETEVKKEEPKKIKKPIRWKAKTTDDSETTE